MAIDARIPMQVTGGRDANPANVLATGTGLRQRQDALDMQRETFDYERQRDEAEAAQPDLDRMMKGFDMTSRVLGSASSPEDYASKLAFVQRNSGLDSMNWGEMPPPTEWTPELSRDMAMQFADIKTQIAQSNADRSYDLSARRTQAAEDTAAAAKAGLLGTRVGGGSTTFAMPGETVAEAEAKAFGGVLIGDFKRAQENAQNASVALDQLNTLKNIDVETGAVEPLRVWATGLAEGLGFDPKKLTGLESATNAQAFEGIAQNIVLSAMQAQKGPQTENDAKRIESTIASMRNTPAAKEFLIDAGIALRERTIEEYEFYQNFEQAQGTFRGASKAWNDYKRATPLIANNPDTGRPVFVNQFLRGIMGVNPGVTRDEALDLWRNKYRR